MAGEHVPHNHLVVNHSAWFSEKHSSACWLISTNLCWTSEVSTNDFDCPLSGLLKKQLGLKIGSDTANLTRLFLKQTQKIVSESADFMKGKGGGGGRKWSNESDNRLTTVHDIKYLPGRTLTCIQIQTVDKWMEFSLLMSPDFPQFYATTKNKFS